jgi:hypothetical protein
LQRKDAALASVHRMNSSVVLSLVLDPGSLAVVPGTHLLDGIRGRVVVHCSTLLHGGQISESQVTRTDGKKENGPGETGCRLCWRRRLAYASLHCTSSPLIFGTIPSRGLSWMTGTTTGEKKSNRERTITLRIFITLYRYIHVHFTL